MDFANALVRWYRSNARSFPWREEWRRSPYCVLVAEILLKRTRAENAVLTYGYLVDCYPDAAALAGAKLPKLEAFLRPIGLHRTRARELKRIAEALVERHGGEVPRSFDELIALPGVGRYVANAVLCFGFEIPVPIVDVNVRRVLGRYFGLAEGVDDGAYWAVASRLLAPGDAAEFNWALLDLGALVCAARGPKCEGCPLAKGCSTSSSSPARAGRTG